MEQSKEKVLISKYCSSLDSCIDGKLLTNPGVLSYQIAKLSFRRCIFDYLIFVCIYLKLICFSIIMN